MLEEVWKQLKEVWKHLQAQIDVGEHKEEKRTYQVEKWLKEAKLLEDQVEEVPVQSQQKAQMEIERLKERAIKLYNKAQTFEFVTHKPTPAIVKLPSPKQIIDMGRPLLELKEKILCDDKEGIISVVGPPGIGKTTLLTSVNNIFFDTNEHGFDVVIFATSKPQMVEIQRQILDRLGFPCQEETEEILATRMLRGLKGKRFLLFLDGFDKDPNLRQIGIPTPNSINKGKVVITSKYESPLKQTGKPYHRVEVNSLCPERSFQLFSLHVGSELPNHKNQITKRIVEECKCKPINLVAAAKYLISIESNDRWEHTLEAVKTASKRKREEEIALPSSANPNEVDRDELIELFKLRYEKLDQVQKDCLSYCALFPEGSPSKEELASYWSAEGLLQEGKDVKEIRSEGYKLIKQINKLIDIARPKGPYEDAEERETVKMPNNVRSFVLLEEARDRFVVKGAPRPKKRPRLEQLEPERISAVSNNVRSLEKLPITDKLKTLILKECRYLEAITKEVFRASTLRVLDLSGTAITAIPSSIKELVELGYLNLSSTKIGSLPKEIGDLTKLKYLGLEGTHSLKIIPRGVISELKDLMLLHLFDSKFGVWEAEQGDQDNDRAGVDELEMLADSDKLGEIGITISNQPALDRYTRSIKLVQCTQRLAFSNWQGNPNLDVPSNFKCIESLRVCDSSELEKLNFGDGGNDAQFSRLEKLTLSMLPNANIPLEICFENLRILEISYCDGLENISWVAKMGRLEEITLSSCKNMTVVIDKKVVEKNCLKALKLLCLKYMESLAEICSDKLELPGLETLEVINCHDLKCLPLSASNLKGLKEIRGQKVWWDSLDWDQHTAKYFQPKFMQTES